MLGDRQSRPEGGGRDNRPWKGFAAALASVAVLTPITVHGPAPAAIVQGVSIVAFGDVEQLAFSSPNDGYGLASLTHGVYLAATTDGGAQWSRAGMALPSPATTAHGRISTLELTSGGDLVAFVGNGTESRVGEQHLRRALRRTRRYQERRQDLDQGPPALWPGRLAVVLCERLGDQHPHVDRYRLSASRKHYLCQAEVRAGDGGTSISMSIER